LDNSHLLTQLDAIKKYPNDFEVTLPVMKKEYNEWSQKVLTKGI
jgi:predicted YcjX-like family ATPase